MGIFSRKKEEENQKASSNAPVKGGKKDEKEEKSMKDLYNDDKAVRKTSKKEDSEKGPAKGNNAYRVLAKPLITEKAGNLGAENKYIFEVYKNANKIEIAKAVEEVYGIRPLSVNVMRIEGKSKRSGKFMGKRKDWKKAIITLPKGKSINIYEGV